MLGWVMNLLQPDRDQLFLAASKAYEGSGVVGSVQFRVGQEA